MQVWYEHEDYPKDFKKFMTKYRRFTPIELKLSERCIQRDSGCIEWIAARDSNGYGRIWHKGQNRTAHTVAYETYVRPIQKGEHVLHSCDNPCCINVKHLWIGTHLDNMRDKTQKGRCRNGFTTKLLRSA